MHTENQKPDKHMPESASDGSSPLTGKAYRLALATSLVLLVVIGLVFLTGRGASQPVATTPEVPADSPVTVAVESTLLEDGSTSRLQVGDTAPDFSYTLADGTQRQLSDFRGRKVLLNFWATWCGPCKLEMPDIEQAVQRFGDEGLTVLAVNHTEPVDTIMPFGHELGLTFPLIANPSGDIIDAYGANGLPTTYFINSDGSVSFKQVGIMNFDFIQQRLEEMQ